MNYAYESPHRDKSTRIYVCVCVCLSILPDSQINRHINILVPPLAVPMATGSSWLFKASGRCLPHFFFFFFSFLSEKTPSFLAQLLFWSPPTLFECIKIAALRLFLNIQQRSDDTCGHNSLSVLTKDSKPRCMKYCDKEHFEYVKTDEI